MKSFVKQYFGVFVGICGILLAVSVYLGIASGMTLVMLIGSCISFFLLGAAILLRDLAKERERKRAVWDLKKHGEALSQESGDGMKALASESVSDLVKAFEAASHQNREQAKQSDEELLGFFKEKVGALEDSLRKSEENTVSELRGAKREMLASVGKLPQEVQEQVMAPMERRLNRALEGNAQKIGEATQRIGEAEKKQQAVLEELEAFHRDFADTHSKILNQIATVHRQCNHLMSLTTMIGTVRSDIAAINEVKAFITELKEGRKVRLVRDDEHGIVIENLMNGDGVRIEKSVMYKNDKLVFEADFDALGCMTRSRNYSETSGTYTEITYESGRATKSVLGKLFGFKK